MNVLDRCPTCMPMNMDAALDALGGVPSAKLESADGERGLALATDANGRYCLAWHRTRDEANVPGLIYSSPEGLVKNAIALTKELGFYDDGVVRSAEYRLRTVS